MAIDARIALGVQPVQQQPNMLAQYAQVMGIKAAQQEMDSNNAMRDLFSGGANFDDPEFQRRGYMANAKGFSELLGKRATTQKTQMEALGKEIDLRRDALVNVNTPEDYLKWHETNHQGKMGNFFKSIGQTPNPEKIMFELSKPGGLEKLKRESALGATKLAQELMQTERSVQVANIGAVAPNRQASVAEQKLAAEQKQRELVRGILTGGETTSVAPPVAGNVSIGGSGVNVSGGGVTPAETRSSIFVNPSSVNAFNPYSQNNLITQPTPAPNFNAGSRVDQIKQQLTQLAKVGGPEANQALEGLIKEYNVLNPEGEIKITSNGTLVSVNKRTNKAEAILGADGKPVMGKVDPVIRSVLDQTDLAGKRMIDVDINQYVPGTGLGADGKGPAPKGVFGISNSQFQPNYIQDPLNPQGVKPVLGSPADPNANLQIGYRQRADGTGQEFIPGGPADPKVIANRTTVTLSAKDKEAREAKYPQATSALKAFNAKTDKFDSVITELLENKKGLDEITGFFAGRTDISAMSKEARRALALFNTITAKGGFSELQDMRNASPTGGALGNVSNQEGGQLIASFGALSRTQDGDDVRKSLITAQNDLRNLKERMGEAYDLTYEYRKPADGGFTYLGREP